MSELLQNLEAEIRHAMGIGATGKTPFHNEILAIAAEEDQKDAVIKALADQLEWAYRDAGSYPDDVHAALRLAGRL